ncbi:MAG: hypothetical protein Q9160_007390 [Pyrenula sp. 1 TL-2023]
MVQEHDVHQFPMSSPIPVPFRNPSRPHSRQSQFGDRARTAPPSSPPSSPPEDGPDKGAHNSEKVNGNTDRGDKISPLDPRRFTPTLHASLVAEILSLRRDLESKATDINHLEDSLYSVKTENDALTVDLATKTREARTLKHEMRLLEGGTETALIDVAKERDKALEGHSDLRNRLEASQKKLNAQEDELKRMQGAWQSESQAWENDRRQLQRQIHVMEGRLKTVLNEIASSQDRDDDEEADQVPNLSEVKSGRHFHRRQTSVTSTGTFESNGRERRVSSPSIARADSTRTPSGNLADELVFDEDEDEEEHENSHGEDGFDSSDALPEERSSSVLSRPIDLKARKLLGLCTDSFGFSSPLNTDQDIPEIDESTDQILLNSRRAIMGQINQKPEFIYQDRGVQYTPPPTPLAQISDGDIKTENIQSANLQQTIEFGNLKAGETKGTSTLSNLQSHHTEDLRPREQVSIACQTDELETEDKSFARGGKSVLPVTVGEHSQVEVQSAATQTDDIVGLSLAKGSANELTIPIIAIHPPASRPSTPNTDIVLPPRTRNVSCQATSMDLSIYRSIAVQTDIIRVDKRLITPTSPILASEPTAAAKSADLTKPTQQKKSVQRSKAKMPLKPLREPPPVPPAVSQTKQPREEEVESDSYPGNNDNGPLTRDSKAESRRPFRTSSLFAGFDSSADIESSQAEAAPFHDDDIFTRPTVSYTLKGGKMVAKQANSSLTDAIAESPDDIANDPFRPPDHDDLDYINGKAPFQDHADVTLNSRPAMERPRPVKLPSNSKQPNFRRAAMVSSSTAAHQSSRVRSPSLPAMGVRPPFPVPTRNSSRNMPLSGSEGTQSPTRVGRGQTPRGERGAAPPRLNLRKVRSTTSLAPLESPVDPNHPSSPLMSPLSYDAESPSLPPLPFDDLPWAHGSHFMKPAPHRVYNPSTADSTDTTLQQTTVVDAIAQTMVGEWMWKYVRKRKSFGVSDSRGGEWDLGKNSEELSAHITSTGTRHKRWVWIEPYERAVMWSSKQPTSGPALLGKGARKLAIQSVLDVRDDNPLPKSATSASASSPISPTAGNLPFNRSILILTPQRALKFTAISQERHYIWLNALSFLSHSPLSIQDLSAFPANATFPSPHDLFEYEYPAPAPPVHGGTGSLRRSHIRDSIRVAKGKGMESAPPSRPGTFTNGAHRSFTTNDSLLLRHKASSIESPPLYYGPNSPITEAADPPNVPRHHSSTTNNNNSNSLNGRRIRANTATSTSTKGGARASSRPRPAIPGAFRSYSANTAMTNTAAIPAMPLPPPPLSATLSIASSSRVSSATANGDNLSRRPSDNSSAGGGSGAGGGASGGMMAVSRYFDSIGTVRMEAFVEEEERQQQERERERRWRLGKGKKAASGRGRGRRKEVEGFGDLMPMGMTMGLGEDPFKGF